MAKSQAQKKLAKLVEQAAQPSAPAQGARMSDVAQPSAIKGPVLVTVSLEGKTEDVASKPLVTAAEMFRAGNALRGLCYNVLNGVLSPEVRDTTSDCWRGISNADKSAFRFLRNVLDGSETLPKDLHGKVKDLTTEQRAGFIRSQWAAYVAENAKKRDEAKAAGKRANVRIRDITLQTLKKLFKGNAPKGGGITGLKEKIAGELHAIEKAYKAKNWGALTKHLAAAISMTESEPAEAAAE